MGECSCCQDGVHALTDTEPADGNTYFYPDFQHQSEQKPSQEAAVEVDFDLAGKYERLGGSCAISKGRSVDIAQEEIRTITNTGNGKRAVARCCWECDNITGCKAFTFRKKNISCVLYGGDDINGTWPDASSECFIYDKTQVDSKVFNRYLHE